MAEALAAIGAIASIVQLADFGFKLSVKLFAFGEAVANADRSVKSLANEISLTATVLRELSKVIKSNENHVSPRAVEATEKTIKECFDVFEELSKALEKSVGDVSSSKDRSEKKKITKIERIKWSFFQPRMDLLRSNLDRLKSSLTLMLQVLAYAQSIKKQEASSKLQYQKTTIEALARSANNADVKYQALQKAIKSTADHDEPSEPMSRATTFVARSITSNSQDGLSAPTARTASRSIDAPPGHVKIKKVGTAEFSPYEDQSSDNKPLVGELILCFNLVHNLLSYHLGVASNPSAYKTYLTLRRSVESAHEAELELLEKQHGDAAYVIGAEAAKNAVLLQRKLRELARQRHDVVPTSSNSEPAEGLSENDAPPRAFRRPARVPSLEESSDDQDIPDDREPVKQREANSEEQKNRIDAQARPAASLARAMITNLADDVDVDELKRMLSVYGQVLNFKVIKERQMVFFDFETGSELRAAIIENPHRLRGNELWVDQRDGAKKVNTSKRDHRPFAWASGGKGRGPHQETLEEDHATEVQPSLGAEREEELLHLEQGKQEMNRASAATSVELSNQNALAEPAADEPYDPYIPRPGQTSRTSVLQAQIDATVGVMRDNISKVSERGERVDSLDDKTDNLAVSAQGFRRGANRVRRRMWLGQFAGPAGGMVDSISAGASVVAGGLQSVGNSIANAFTGPEVTQVADDSTSNTVLSDFERYEDAINRLDDLALGLERPIDDDEGEEDENDDEQGRDVTQKLLAEWTTLDSLHTQ